MDSFPLQQTFLAQSVPQLGVRPHSISCRSKIDIWGAPSTRHRGPRRADLLNADETRKAVISTLVSDVASDYFQLLQFDAELADFPAPRWRHAFRHSS